MPVAHPMLKLRISSDQWTVSLVTSPAALGWSSVNPVAPSWSSRSPISTSTSQNDSGSNNFKRAPGGLAWVPAGVTHTLTNNSSKPAQFVTLEFKPEQKK